MSLEVLKRNLEGKETIFYFGKVPKENPVKSLVFCQTPLGPPPPGLEKDLLRFFPAPFP